MLIFQRGENAHSILIMPLEGERKSINDHLITLMNFGLEYKYIANFYFRCRYVSL